jgi:hypothetical protein
MEKRGLSAVVATVLLILLAIMAVVVVWAFVVPFVNNQLDEGTACVDADYELSVIAGEHTCYKPAPSSRDTIWAFAQIERGDKEFDLADVGVVVSLRGNTFSGPLHLSEYQIPDPGERKIIKGSFRAGGYDTIKVYPIIRVKGRLVNCEPSPPVKFGSCAS